jgi:23S rRNA (pseudouridine1915-N3)-methyltransferase
LADVKIKILCVGKLKEKYWRDAAAEYQKRIGRFCALETVELAEEPTGGKGEKSAAQIEKALAREGAAMLAKIKSADAVLPLCVEGEQLSSEAFAAFLEEAKRKGGDLVFLVGSSHGLSESVKARGALRLSFSKATLPHQLARVVLTEQIYRALKIGAGERYHK